MATQVAEAVASLATALEVEAATRAAADSVDPGSELLLQKAERAERSVREDLERAERQTQRGLEVELRTLGRDGLGEQLAEVEGKLERVRLQAEAKEREEARRASSTRRCWKRNGNLRIAGSARCVNASGPTCA
ncbi:hypothetical protein ACU4GR_12755 [Methylobacterium oryzae CBMB20]